MNTQHTASRRLFVAGRIRTRRFHRPCRLGNHAGPLLNTAKYDGFPEAMWHGFGECAACGSTIHISQLRRAA